MNVRIEEQKFRVKISEDELSTLVNGHHLHVKIGLMGRILVVTINPQGNCVAMTPKLVMRSDEVYLNLLISSQTVQDLSDIGRSRAGLEQEVDGLLITLQVDVREDSRTVGKR